MYWDAVVKPGCSRWWHSPDGLLAVSTDGTGMYEVHGRDTKDQDFQRIYVTRIFPEPFDAREKWEKFKRGR